MSDFPVNEPCPWLPETEGGLGPDSTRRHGEKGAEFYLAALTYAQSLWMEGKPAQAILQLNKAWMADLSGKEGILKMYPSPYHALKWIVREARGGKRGFMGDPVRHFQHLASRMSGPRSEIRSWRAWACFWITAKELEGLPFYRDGPQIAREGLWIPSRNRVASEVLVHGWSEEENALKSVLIY